MTPQRAHIDYLRDILEAIDKAVAFTRGMSAEQFCADDKTVFAVIRALEVIGEAAKKIPTPVRERYPKVPWREMTGIRDKLIHDYVGVNEAVVWKTVQMDLPILRPLVMQMLDEASS